MFKTELTPPLRALSALALMLPLAALATPTITVDRVQQRYPWNGLVDIDYTISGVEGENPLELFVEFAATLPSGPVVPKTFVQCAPCDLPSSNGTFRVTWNVVADCGEVVTTEAKLSAKICSDPVSVNDADYLVIYLDAGKGAESWPVRCVSAADMPSSFFNRDVYKLSRVVMKRVSAGKAWLGTGVGGNGVLADVKNVVRYYAEFTHDFHFGIFPVTQRQYLLMSGQASSAHGSGAEAPMRPVNISGNGKGGSWAYISSENGPLAALSAKVTDAGGTLLGGFTFPSESQWEYVCRAGTTTAYFWGSDVLLMGEYAWFANNSGGVPHAVGGLKPNPWGFYDMLGNVMEWTQDSYDKTNAAFVGTEESPIKDPLQTVGDCRVSRGQSYANEGFNCSTRTTNRKFNEADINSGREGGFRLYRLIEQ